MKTRMYDIHHNCFWGQAGTIYLDSSKHCTKVNYNLCKWTQICLLCKLYSTRDFGWGGDVGQASWLGLIRDTPWFPTDHNHCHDHHILLNKNWHRMRTITFTYSFLHDFRYQLIYYFNNTFIRTILDLRWISLKSTSQILNPWQISLAIQFCGRTNDN